MNSNKPIKENSFHQASIVFRFLWKKTFYFQRSVQIYIIYNPYKVVCIDIVKVR